MSKKEIFYNEGPLKRRDFLDSEMDWLRGYLIAAFVTVREEEHEEEEEE